MPESSPDPTVVVPGVDALRPEHGRLFVVVGVFDGLHLGHAYLLRHLGAGATVRGARPAVITFDHHPDEILVGTAPPLLCDPDERLSLLAQAGVEVTVVQHFDVALRMSSYEDFVRRITSRIDLAGFLMTPDSAFGHERGGTPTAVAALGAVLGYDVEVVPSLDLDGRPVRSAEIRSDIASGDLASARRLLGRPYSVIGDVTGRAEAGVHVRFPMPVALPPVGRYEARVEPVTGPGATAASVTVRLDGTLDLGRESVAGPDMDRVRITFA